MELIRLYKDKELGKLNPGDQDQACLKYSAEFNKVQQGQTNFIPYNANTSHNEDCFLWTSGLNPCIGIVIEGTIDSIKEGKNSSEMFAILDHNDGEPTDLFRYYTPIITSNKQALTNATINNDEIISRRENITIDITNDGIKFKIDNKDGTFPFEKLLDNISKEKRDTVKQEIKKLTTSIHNKKFKVNDFSSIIKEIIIKILARTKLLGRLYERITRDVLYNQLNNMITNYGKTTEPPELHIKQIAVFRCTSKTDDNNSTLAAALKSHLEKDMLSKVLLDINSDQSKFSADLKDQYQLDIFELPEIISGKQTSINIAAYGAKNTLRVLYSNSLCPMFQPTPPTSPETFESPNEYTKKNTQEKFPANNVKIESLLTNKEVITNESDNIVDNMQKPYTTTNTNFSLLTNDSLEIKKHDETLIANSYNKKLVQTKKKNKTKKRSLSSNSESDTSDNNSKSNTTPKEKMIITEKPLSVEQKNKNKKFKKGDK